MAKRSSVRKPKIVVRNIDELAKRVPKAERLLIHFTKAQWAGITKGIKRGKTLPKRGVIFAYTPLPDNTGGIGGGDCIPGHCEICSIRIRPTREGFVGMDCRCRRDPRCPPEDLPEPSGNCRLVFRRQGLNWRLACESIDCRAGRCQLNIVRRGPRWLLSCACR